MKKESVIIVLLSTILVVVGYIALLNTLQLFSSQELKSASYSSASSVVMRKEDVNPYMDADLQLQVFENGDKKVKISPSGLIL